MIISTCGFGNTGASAVLDFLRGYRDVQLVDDFEYQLIHEPDGINDLKYHLTQNKERISSNASIKRFMRLNNHSVARRLRKRGINVESINQRYLSQIITVSWKGCSNFDPDDVSNICHTPFRLKIQRGLHYILRHINSAWHYPAFQTRYFSMMSEDKFDEITKEYLKDLFLAMGYDINKMIITDMLFSATNPGLGMEFFDGAKAIIVYRDPIDLFVRATTHKATNAYFPCCDVKQFVSYYSTLMANTTINDNVLCVQYEDLIYKYYPTTQRIMDFLGYKNRPQDEFKHFNPDVSVKYTNNGNKSEFINEIEYIKKHLSKYIYEFSGYIPVSEQKKIFEGE